MEGIHTASVMNGMVVGATLPLSLISRPALSLLGDFWWELWDFKSA
jgi:hypothetical protein